MGPARTRTDWAAKKEKKETTSPPHTHTHTHSTTNLHFFLRALLTVVITRSSCDTLRFSLDLPWLVARAQLCNCIAAA